MEAKHDNLNMESMEAKKRSIYYDMLPKDSKGRVSMQALWHYLGQQGIKEDDPRLQNIRAVMAVHDFNPSLFDEIVKNNRLLRKAFSRSLIIPDFTIFCNELEEIFNASKANEKGKVADYIPQLARVNPDHFAVSICTVDGQHFSMGDAETKFCLQSSCKPINYCLALEENGEELVHQHVGREPSGHSFNELSLNKEKLPHNPLINAGAIMCLSLIQRDKEIYERFEYVNKTWEALCADRPVYFNNSVYQSERETADRNFALAYFMREHKAFPKHTKLEETLEFYFQCCSIESCTADLSIAAATLANAGLNPLSGQKIFSETTIQHCMSLMLSCGMYDYSGEFAFRVGLPAKSGVSGVIMVVIPNVMGICIWSPRLDAIGNSARGLEFCERLVNTYNFHNYDSLRRSSQKKNPRLRKRESEAAKVLSLIWAASNGDMGELLRICAEGVDLGMADYDGRTALHLAASDNQLEVLEYLIKQGVALNPRDRWGGTPLSDAKREGHTEIIKALETAMAKLDD